MKSWVAVFLVGLCLTMAGCSISPAKNEDLAKSYSDLSSTVINEGNVPPAFSLSDADGKPFSLSAALRQSHVLLLFYRGEWCPYCIDQLDSLQSVLPKLAQHNVQIVAISPDEASAVLNTQRRFGQRFVFLSDPNLKVTARYGLASNKDLPHPAVFLLKKADSLEHSEVLWLYASEDHTVRPTGTQLLHKVQKLLPK